MIGRLYLRFCQMLEKNKYNRILNNGSDVYAQNALASENYDSSIIKFLSFKNGMNFLIRDGRSAAQVFNEIYLNKRYSSGKLLHSLKTANVIIDIGANIGLFTYYASQVAPDAHIYAFEADPANYQLLQSNIKQLPQHLQQRISTENTAVSSSLGTIPFYSSEISGWSSCFKTLGAKDGNQIIIPAIRLSDYLTDHGIDKIDYLKISVVGAEYDILLGDKALLEKNIRVLVIGVDLYPRDEKYQFNDLLLALKDRFKIVNVNSTPGSYYPVISCSCPI